MFSFFSCFKTQPAETYCSTMLFFHVFPLQGSILGEGVHVLFFFFVGEVSRTSRINTATSHLYVFFNHTFKDIYYESQLAGQLLFANEVRIGGVGGVVAERERNLAVPLC